ncbi:MAG: LuxR C-terminal-related transcriptional regulator [Firmicutes bacterium]|nr:LuxR C-terminal-related transcriptional regulator [Bacillota bacterium]
MSIFYGVVCLLSLILLIAYFFVDKKQNKWLMLLFISVAICNTGYFMLSVSSNLTFALISNSIAYVGNIFLPFFMLMLILDVCKIKHNKVLTYSLLAIGVIMLFIATSGGYLPIYYKEVSLELVNGGARLVKEYGVLHNLYYVYLLGYMLSMIVIIIYAIAKKKIKSKMHAIFLSVIVLGNILVWLIEQFVEHQFEFLCLSYIVNEMLLLLLYGILREYEKKMNAQLQNGTSSADLSLIDFNDKFSEEQIAIIFERWEKINNLTKREREVLKHILLGEKRKDIAVKLYISDSTVKNIITNILSKLEVDNREELYKIAKKII